MAEGEAPNRNFKEEVVRYYEPWIGSHYYDSPLSGVRVLIVGESSYEVDTASDPYHLRDDTRDVVSGSMPVKYAKFWRYIQRSMTGKHPITALSQASFWESVALVNLIQVPMSNKKKRPSHQDFSNGVEALKSYITQLKPERVVVYSKTARPFLVAGLDLELVPHTHYGSVAPLDSISALYKPTGHEGAIPRFLLLRHPSARPGMSATKWHPVTSKFLE